MEFKWQKIDFRVYFPPAIGFTPIVGDGDCVRVKAISVESAIVTALKSRPECYRSECTSVQIMTSEGWEILPVPESYIIFQIPESESQPLECLSKALPLIRSVINGHREVPLNCSFSSTDRFFSVRIEKCDGVFIVRLESHPRDSRFAEAERRIIASENFESDRLKVFDNYSGKTWDSTAVQVRDRVDCEIKAIFDRLLEQNISVNDAFTILSLAVFDARLDAVLDRQYQNVSEQWQKRNSDRF